MENTDGIITAIDGITTAIQMLTNSEIAAKQRSAIETRGGASQLVFTLNLTQKTVVITLHGIAQDS